MITVVMGSIGCLSKNTKVETIDGSFKIKSLLFKHKRIKVISENNIIFTYDYIVKKTSLKEKIKIVLGNKKFICSPDHRWLVYNGIEIFEIKAKELLKYGNKKTQNKKSIRGNECFMDRIRRKKDCKSISTESKHSKTTKNIQCEPKYNNSSFKKEWNKNKALERTTSIRFKTGNVEKRISWKKESVLQAWKIYWTERKSKKIFRICKRNINMDLRILRIVKNKQSFRSDSSSQRWQFEKQSKTKPKSFMSSLSCQTAYVTKIRKKEYMYDIIVPDYNNFILEGGYVTHNSGKTASMVREMMTDKSGRMFYSNIITKGLKNNTLISPEMIYVKTQRFLPNGKPVLSKGYPVYDYRVNQEFWEQTTKKYQSINIIIDEAHSILNSRRSMGRKQQVVLDWLALLRRVIGTTKSGYGRLYLITQIERRLDIVAKEQMSQARFHLCHCKKSCPRCHITFAETNEIPNPKYTCPRCNTELVEHSHIVEVWEFQDYECFVQWKYLSHRKTYYKHYFVTDIEKVFPHYNTLQWDNLLVDN